MSTSASSDPGLDGAGPSAQVTAAYVAIASIASVADEIGLIAVIKQAVNALGAEAASFTGFVHDDATLTTYRSLYACNPAWASLCASQGWAAADPWLAYARRCTAPALASALAPLDATQQAFTRAAGEHGFRSAVVVPAPSAHGSSQAGVLCVGSSVAGHFENGSDLGTLKPVLRALAMELNDWCVKQLGAALRSSAQLTDDDMTLLRHEAAGRGSKAIARELEVRATTIDCRFQRLSMRLGVATRRDAVRIARLYGLI